jgi:hypothetical protein
MRHTAFKVLIQKIWLGSLLTCLGLFGTLAVFAMPDLRTAFLGRAFAGDKSGAPLTIAPTERVEVEALSLRPSGFEPAAITRPRGEFYIAIYNHTGIEELLFTLNHETGRREHEVRLSRGKKKAGDLLNLPPGNYTLVVADHPEWSCSITINPY